MDHELSSRSGLPYKACLHRARLAHCCMWNVSSSMSPNWSAGPERETHSSNLSTSSPPQRPLLRLISIAAALGTSKLHSLDTGAEILSLWAHSLFSFHCLNAGLSRPPLVGRHYQSTRSDISGYRSRRQSSWRSNRYNSTSRVIRLLNTVSAFTLEDMPSLEELLLYQEQRRQDRYSISESVDNHSSWRRTSRVADHSSWPGLAPAATKPQPTGQRVRSHTMRTLANENKDLQLQLEDSRKSHDAKVKEVLSSHKQIEAQMREHLQMVNAESEIKSSRIRELEWEVECLLMQTRPIHDLGVSTQHDIDSVEVSDNVLNCPSPLQLDPASAPITSPKHFTRPSTFISSMLATPQAPDMSSGLGRSMASTAPAKPRPLSYGLRHSFLSDISSIGHWSEQRASTQPRSHPNLDHGASNRSTPFASSRPVSLVSNGSTELQLLPFSFTPEALDPSRKRKMRRFVSGSRSLKPLVLANSTSFPSSLNSSTSREPLSSTAAHSETSLFDPTTAFLSNASTLASSTNTAASDAWGHPEKSAHNEALDILEGRRPGRLQHELDCAFPHSYATIRARGQLTRPVALRSGPQSNGNDPMTSIRQRDIQPTEARVQSLRRRVRTLSKTKATGQRGASQSSVVTDHRPLSKAITGTISSLMQAKDNPALLMQRVLSGMWSMDLYQSLGGIGWWILGLVYYHDARSGTPLRTARRNLQQVEQNTWQHEFSAEASRHRATRSHVRSMVKSGHLDANRLSVDWLSPPHVYTQADKNPHAEFYTNGNTDDDVFLPHTRCVHTTSKALPPFFSTQSQSTSRCPHCIEPSSRRTLRLWLQFSLALVLAVGLAIKEGPGALYSKPFASESVPSSDEAGTDKLGRLENTCSATGRDNTSDTSDQAYDQQTPRPHRQRGQASSAKHGTPSRAKMTDLTRLSTMTSERYSFVTCRSENENMLAPKKPASPESSASGDADSGYSTGDRGSIGDDRCDS